MQQLLDELPDLLAEALALHFAFGYTVEEIAATAAISPNTVWSRLRLGKRALRRKLGRDAQLAELFEIPKIERGVTAFARSSNSGLIVTTGGTGFHREPIIALALRYRLPAIYPFRYHAVDGGLISYGPDTHEPIRRAAGYVDRILKGEKPADLPVQAPTKYELAINLKTAKALGLEVPPSLLARADEVIE